MRRGNRQIGLNSSGYTRFQLFSMEEKGEESAHLTLESRVGSLLSEAVEPVDRCRSDCSAEEAVEGW